MFGLKAKPEPEEPTYEPEPMEREEDLPTWADGRYGPQNSATRVYGRLPGDELYEARLAAAE